MNFFDDAVLEIVLEDVTSGKNGRFVWTGHVFGENESSSVTLSGNDEVLVGNIRTSDAYYQIRTSPQGVPMVVQIDDTLFPECGTTDDHAFEVAPAPPLPRNARLDSADQFDLLVVYTPSARSAVGGTASMEALIDLAISETNTIYSNSQINSQVRLMHQEEVEYTEAGFGADLNRVRAKNDGFMDEVHELRDEFGADFVVLLINDGQYCGLAGLMTFLSAGFESSAFSAVHYSCATGYYSFAHEIGHNQGAEHANPESSQGSGLYNYSHGWRWSGSDGQPYRSVMAYSPGNRVPYFSNPNVNHLGAATGQPLGLLNEAYNALGINNVASTVANFRLEATGLAVTPGTPYSSVISYDDVATGSTYSYTLHNLGDSSVNWTATEAVGWATLSSTSGTIPADSTVQLELQLTGSVDSLDPGFYTTTITVTDTTNGTTHDRVFRLQRTGPIRHLFTLDSDPGWTHTGNWDFGIPLGQGSANGDPTSGHTGDNVYGYAIGAVGDYPNNMAEETLTTQSFDLSGLSNVQLSFYRWLGVESGEWDHAKVQVSNNGSTWVDVWENTGEITDNSWAEQTYDVSATADNQPNVSFRWVMGTTDSSVTYPGWNIDDISISGLLPDAIMSEVWVDFGAGLTGMGTESNPFDAIGEAADKVTGSGTIRIKGDSVVTVSDEALSISKPMTVLSSNGVVQIGVAP